MIETRLQFLACPAWGSNGEAELLPWVDAGRPPQRAEKPPGLGRVR